MMELSELALAALKGANRSPYPTQEVNPGIIRALMSRGYIVTEDRPSPFRSHKAGTLIPHVVITEAGRMILEGGDAG